MWFFCYKVMLKCIGDDCRDADKRSLLFFCMSLQHAHHRMYENAADDWSDHFRQHNRHNHSVRVLIPFAQAG